MVFQLIYLFLIVQGKGIISRDDANSKTVAEKDATHVSCTCINAHLVLSIILRAQEGDHMNHMVYVTPATTIHHPLSSAIDLPPNAGAAPDDVVVSFGSEPLITSVWVPLTSATRAMVALFATSSMYVWSVVLLSQPHASYAPQRQVTGWVSFVAAVRL